MLLEQSLVTCLGWTLVHFVWQGTAIAAIFAVLRLLAGNSGAHICYALACSALALMALCPVATFGLLCMSAPLAVHKEWRPATIIEIPAEHETAQGPADVAQTRVANPPILTPHAPFSRPNFGPAPSAGVAQWLRAFVGLWLTGVVALSLRHAGGWLMLRRLRRDARLPADEALLRTLAALKERLGVTRAVELLESARLATPVVVGFLKPAILFPARILTGLDPGQLEAVLAHELAHVRRCDFPINLLQCALETALFYHPAVWWVSRIARQQREFCADDVALSICVDRDGFARALARFAELAPSPAVAAAGGNVLTRIRRIVGRPATERSGAVPVLSVLLIALALTAAFRIPRALADDHKTIEVKAGESIQAAVDGAPNGAVIRVAAGEYRERLLISKPLTLEGAGWEKTRLLLPAEDEKTRKDFEDLIQAAKTREERDALIERSRVALSGPALLVAEARNVKVSGFRIASDVKTTESSQPPPLAEFRNAQVGINGCAFTGPSQDGIHILDGADVEMADCLVAGLWGEGIIISGARGADPRVTIRESEIRNVYHYGIVIGRGCDRVAVQRCRISGTAWHGIRYDSASPLIEGCTIYAHARSGIYASGRTHATVRGNLFYRNEMSGISCWFQNEDLIESNTFANNLREAVAVLGASKPRIRANIFWDNVLAIKEGQIDGDDKLAVGGAVLDNNLFWKNEKRRETGEKETELTTESKSVQVDPGFANADQGDFSLGANSAARKVGAGVVQPLVFAGPWPILEEEKQLIPEGASRDSNAWKKRSGAKGSASLPVNEYQRQSELYKTVEPIVKDALQIDDAEKRAVAVEKIRKKIESKSDEEAAAGLAAYQSIGAVSFDKKSFHDPLIAKLDSADAFVRAHAISSLSGGAGSREDLERIVKLAKDDTTEVRRAVGWALVWLSQKDLMGSEGAKWVEMFEEGNAAFRKEMIHGLWGVKTTDALQERLAKISREPGPLAYDALYYALSTSPNKGAACVTRLIEYLADPDSINIAGRASWGLGYGVQPGQEARVADAMLKLYSAREDGYLRKNALTSLSNYAGAQHVPELEKLIAKPGISADDKKTLEEIISSAKRRK